MALELTKIDAQHPILAFNFRQTRGHLLNIEERLALETPVERERLADNLDHLHELRRASPRMAQAYEQGRGHLLAIEEHILLEKPGAVPHNWCKYKHGDLCDVGHIQPTIAALTDNSPEPAEAMREYEAELKALLEKPDLKATDMRELRRRWDEMWGFDPDLERWNTAALTDVGHLQEVAVYAGDIDPEFVEDVMDYRRDLRQALEDPGLKPSRIRELRNRWRDLWQDQTLEKHNPAAAECVLCSKDTEGTRELAAAVAPILDDLDPGQLEAGIGVEMEHTDDPVVAERIARDHLREIPDYYTRLSEMERVAGLDTAPATSRVHPLHGFLPKLPKLSQPHLPRFRVPPHPLVLYTRWQADLIRRISGQ